MYREEILEHYKNPRNHGELDEPAAEGENPNCGDHVKINLEIEEGIIEKVRHETEGCAICTAAASVMSQELEGMEKSSVQNLDSEWMKNLLEIDISPMRLKCALLPLKTVQRALEEGE